MYNSDVTVCCVHGDVCKLILRTEEGWGDPHTFREMLSCTELRRALSLEKRVAIVDL